MKIQKLKLKLKEANKFTSTSKPQDFGANPGYTTANLPEQQETNSIESAQSVITEEAEKKNSLLPDKPPKNNMNLQLAL